MQRVHLNQCPHHVIGVDTSYYGGCTRADGGPCRNCVTCVEAGSACTCDALSPWLKKVCSAVADGAVVFACRNMDGGSLVLRAWLDGEDAPIAEVPIRALEPSPPELAEGVLRWAAWLLRGQGMGATLERCVSPSDELMGVVAPPAVADVAGGRPWVRLWESRQLRFALETAASALVGVVTGATRFVEDAPLVTDGHTQGWEVERLTAADWEQRRVEPDSHWRCIAVWEEPAIGQWRADGCVTLIEATPSRSAQRYLGIASLPSAAQAIIQYLKRRRRMSMDEMQNSKLTSQQLAELAATGLLFVTWSERVQGFSYSWGTRVVRRSAASLVGQTWL